MTSNLGLTNSCTNPSLFFRGCKIPSQIYCCESYSEMPIRENNRPKSKRFNINDCSVSKYSTQINNSKKSTNTLSKNYSPKDEEFYSLISFYDSIPDYRDIHHLSEYEFQNQLLMLKQKQCEIFPSKVDCLEQKNINFQCDSALTSCRKNADLDIDFAGLINKNDELNSTINSCLRNRPVVGVSREKINDEFQNPSYKCYRSKSVSPTRLTVPHPFKMTQREEKEHMLKEFTNQQHKDSETEKEAVCEIKSIPSHSVPLTSKIPLYDRIVAEKAHKSELAKLNSAIELQSQMKPFHFSERIPCQLKRSHTSPQLTTPINSTKNKCFRAKPCPKNLFSNYFYNKMWEDEYFRALNRKLRAEELLKISSLPPSMKKRNKESPKSEKSNSSASKRGKRRRKVPKHLSTCNKEEQKQNEFITTSSNLFKFETEKRSATRNSKSPSYCVSNTSSKSSSGYPSPLPIYPSARPNLAANLRVEWARKKLSEMSMKADRNITKDRFRIPSWGIRKSTAWKSLYYDHTNDEDISLRLAQRRAEQKLHQEEHQIKMEIMRQRVRATPLLLEGPPHWGPRTQSHDCRYGKAVVDEKTNDRPCSSSTNVSKFSSCLEKKSESKNKSGS